jgi:hypothetical protein
VQGVKPKAKISANGTYVFDREDIEQLDELSLTSMIKAIDPGQPPDEAERSDPKPIACAGDTTINSLLEEPDSEAPTYVEPAAALEQDGDLLAPELIFTERPTDEG